MQPDKEWFLRYVSHVSLSARYSAVHANRDGCWRPLDLIVVEGCGSVDIGAQVVEAFLVAIAMSVATVWNSTLLLVICMYFSSLSR